MAREANALKSKTGRRNRVLAQYGNCCDCMRFDEKARVPAFQLFDGVPNCVHFVLPASLRRSSVRSVPMGF